MKKIHVTYDESDIAQMLKTMIIHPNQEEFIKLFTPIISSSDRASTLFFRLLTGAKLPDVIPDGRIIRIHVDKLGFIANKAGMLQSSHVDSEGFTIAVIKGFRGYHEYAKYMISFTNIDALGHSKVDATWVDDTDFEVLEDI